MTLTEKLGVVRGTGQLNPNREPTLDTVIRVFDISPVRT